MEEVAAMYKLEKVRKISKIGSYGSTFNANFDRVPKSIFNKCTVDEIAQLVDAFYQCYSDGKNAK